MSLKAFLFSFSVQTAILRGVARSARGSAKPPAQAYTSQGREAVWGCGLGNQDRDPQHPGFTPLLIRSLGSPGKRGPQES